MTEKPPVPPPAQGIVWAKCPTTCAKGADACLAAGRCLQEGTPVQSAGVITVSTAPMTDWKCCGCGKSSPDQRRNCNCPTRALYRPGTRESACKIEPESAEDRKARAETAESRAEKAEADLSRALEALRKAIPTLAASRHLICKYTPDHHWLPEHDQRIAELRELFTTLSKGGGNG